MPLFLKLALLALTLPFVYAFAFAGLSDDGQQVLVEVVVGTGVLAAIVGIPVFIVTMALQALSPPRRGGS